MSDVFQVEEDRPIILKKKPKTVEGAHGGAWKVAYADFVTAMMAFFLLLWLLNATTEDQMHGIAEYFAPTNISDVEAGAGEAMRGLAIAVEGALRSDSSRPSVSVPIPTFGEEAQGDQQGEKRQDETQTKVEKGKAQALEEQRTLLDVAMAELRQAINDAPELRDIQDSLLIEVTPEGLRIQILDQDKNPMFDGATDQLTRYAKRLLALVGTIVARLPNDISVTGHTSTVNPGGQDPWTISSDRALATVDWLVYAGLPRDRIVAVEGKGDTEPLDPRHPDSPRNRRISILLTNRINGMPATNLNRAKQTPEPPPDAMAPAPDGASPGNAADTGNATDNGNAPTLTAPSAPPALDTGQ